jgi:hypothetical protein
MALSVGQLRASLQKTLNAYPQWAGQLQFVRYKSGGDHTQRGGRVVLSYGGTADPGVELIMAHCPCLMPSLIPSVAKRAAGLGLWDAGQVSLEELIPKGHELALSDNHKSDFDGLPCVVIQLTTFDCGGVAIAMRMAHCLTDTQTMVQFISDWARLNRAIVAHAPIPTLSPIFDPSLLDRAAAGDIDAAKADPKLIEAARALPVRRFDPPALADGLSSSINPSTQIPMSLRNLGSPVGRYIVYFSPKEIQCIWEDASSSGTSITHLESLIALVWSLMMRNERRLEHDEQTADMNVVFNVRSRLSLPPTFVGSPILLACITGKKSMPLQALANTIRSSLAQFTTPNLSALLHAKAYEDSPHRLWAAFVKNRKSSLTYAVTSWLRLGVNEVDFGAGSIPRHVETFLPSDVDGCVQIMEAGDGNHKATCAEGRRWYDERVSVSLHLKEEVMQSILKDPLWWKYKRVDRERVQPHRRFASAL